MHKLVLIRHGESTWNLENRFTGWTDVPLTDTGVAQARQAARDLFAATADRPDAVFVAGDLMAIVVLDTLRHELGLAVPQDVSVVGFDNVPQAGWASYELTTFEQPVEPMVEATVALLQGYLREAQTPPSRNLVVPGQLIIRQSARVSAPGSQQT